MSIFDKAKNKADEFLKSEEGERRSDEFLDKAAQHATDRFGEDKAEHIRKVRDAVDERIGTDQPTPGQQADPGDLADPNQPSPDTPPAR
ncbi:Rv0909 family putative TA system antitoxin [Corynebacterium sp.]|uniref:Rv0909 family putative TA system antitoxin n=1 Tax=Corynebacterium sp. TaxID=1720 RepID=UPI0019986501|nr:Rv0909 family putative TA system antitoxin [Corynebacterium sp.]HHU67682.1 antitoxin [Corynebacterium sp.]HKM25054.1 Rv0909 family putative TA system antitoxin [Corynebacterium sp.]